MKAMILAAGRGERMGSLTTNIPKPLIKVAGIALIEHNIIRLKNAGITEIVINICWLGHKIQNHIGDGKKLGVNITYLDEKDHMLGTGGGIAKAIKFFRKEPFWLVNADLYTTFQIPKKKYLKPNSFGHLILVPNPKHHPSGDFFLKEGFLSVKSGNRPYTYSGISLLSPKLFDDVKDTVFPLEPILELAAQNGYLTGEFYEGLWTDVGTKARLLELTKFLDKSK